MKKILFIGLMVVLTMAFVACSKPVEHEMVETDKQNTDDSVSVEVSEAESFKKVELKIATLKGPTGMGMVQLMANDENGTSELDYTFEIVGAPDQILGQIVQGKVDIAAVPSNMAAILNVKTEDNIQLLGVNTLGVLFILEYGDTLRSIEDLEDKTILASGKGASPEYVLNYILDQNGLSDSVTVSYASEHAEVATKLNAGETLLALLPQPFVTATMLNNKEARIAIDLTKEWANITNGMVLPMGAVVVNRKFAADNPQVIETFMKEYAASIEFVNSSPVDAGELIEKYGILPKSTLATKAIPMCNITLMNARDAKESVMKFYEVLFGFNPKSIGGKMPEEDFFYGN